MPVLWGTWPHEARAYVVACVARTIADNGSSMFPSHAYAMARWAARVAEGAKFIPKGWTNAVLSHTKFPCRICGKDATTRVYIYGYCHTHKAEGEAHFNAGMGVEVIAKASRVRHLLTKEKGMTNYPAKEKAENELRRTRGVHRA